MSIQFSDTTNRTGLVQRLEDVTGTQSSTGFTLAMKTSYINQAYAYFLMLANMYAGKWQVDDTNQTDLAILVDDLVIDQKDYNFNLDANSNQILEIWEVQVKDSAGNWKKLKLLDTSDSSIPLEEKFKTSGTPEYFDPSGSGFFIYPPAIATIADGLKLKYSRTPAYFTTGSTTTKPGIPDMFHDYLYLRAGYAYCRDNRLPQKDDLKADLAEIQNDMENFYSKRLREQKTVVRMKYNNPR